jgi:hypothetical protein
MPDEPPTTATFFASNNSPPGIKHQKLNGRPHPASSAFFRHSSALADMAVQYRSAGESCGYAN